MKLTNENLTRKITIPINGPKGQDMTVKRPYYAEGNLAWCRTNGYLDDLEFTPKAEAAGLVEVKVVENVSDFGRGVRGQTMFVPRAETEKRLKGYFEIAGEEAEAPRRGRPRRG